MHLILLVCILASWVMTQFACDSEIFCRGHILDTIQKAELFLDPKRFVDMPTRFSESKVMKDFNVMKSENMSNPALQAFLDTNFHRAGHELRIVIPPDHKAIVPVFEDLQDQNLREFAYKIHSKWRSLLRQVDKSLICAECESTALDLPYPFLVPGGRFREYYYWDTYWILEGIYVSGMCRTAKAVVENTIWMAEKYGFVPNGSRTYYLNRSQPPMLPMIIQSYLDHCGEAIKKPDVFIKKALSALRKEHAFWMERRGVQVEDAQGKSHTLNFYSADMSMPRPESYMHDIRLAKNMTSTESKVLFHNVAATTESGWDFSGRWMNWTANHNGSVPGLDKSITSEIIPADLNAVLFRNELIISRLYARLGQREEEAQFADLSEARKAAIQAVLWVPELNMWKDYDYAFKRPLVNRPFYITDICPLWYGPYKNITVAEVETIISQNARIMTEYPSGIPISETYTGQQWDFPNVWAPTQYQAVKLYLRLHKLSQNPAHFKSAVEVAQKWISTTYCGMKRYGYVFEKYNAEAVGEPGGGGEYVVQEGFGWSNGVVLWMIKELGDNLTIPDACPEPPGKGKVQEEEPIDPMYVLAVLVWIISALLCATYATMVIVRLLWPRRPDIPIEREELLDF